MTPTDYKPDSPSPSITLDDCDVTVTVHQTIQNDPPWEADVRFEDLTVTGTTTEYFDGPMSALAGQITEWHNDPRRLIAVNLHLYVDPGQ